MTTLEDLYIYYCRRCDCAPNSLLKLQLKEAYDSAEEERNAFTAQLLHGAKGNVKRPAPPPPPAAITTPLIGAGRRALAAADSSSNEMRADKPFPVVDGKAAAVPSLDDTSSSSSAHPTIQSNVHKLKNELALLDPTYSRNNNPNMTEIDLSSNYVGPKGLEPVLLLVKNLYSVKTLRLAHNMLTHESVMLIANHLCGGGEGGGRPHPSLETIDLRSNLLHNGSVAHLIHLVESNPRLTTLLLEGNEGLTETEVKRVQSYVTKNVEQLKEEVRVAAAEDEISAKARADRPKYLAHKAKLEGLRLSKEASGGHFHFATWRQNPQFTFRVSHATSVGFTLIINEPIVTTRQYGFAVVRNGKHASFGSALRVIDVISKEALAEKNAEKTTNKGLEQNENGKEITSKRINEDSYNVILAESAFHERRAHLELFLDANCGDNDTPYTIVVYTFAPGKECPSTYSLAAEITDADFADRERAFVRLEPLCPEYDWSQVTLEGRWGEGVNGHNMENTGAGGVSISKMVRNESVMGPLPFASWRENESFRVQLDVSTYKDGGGQEGSSPSSKSVTSRVIGDATEHSNRDGANSTVVEDVLVVESAMVRLNKENTHNHYGNKNRSTVSNKSPATKAMQQGEEISAALRSVMGHSYKSTSTSTHKTTTADEDTDTNIVDEPTRGKGYIDAKPSHAGQPPNPLRLAKTLASGMVTVYIVLTKSNDSDVNDENEIGFYVVTPDRRGRIPMRIIATQNNSAQNATQQTLSRVGLPIIPARPPTATDGSLIAYCPHAKKSSVTLAVELPVSELDFFVIPTTSKPLPITAAVGGGNSVPFTIQFFSTAAVSVKRYLYGANTHANANANGGEIKENEKGWWCSEWGLPKELRLALDASTSGGCRQDNKASWVHNHAIELFNARVVDTRGENPKGDEGEEEGGIDICVSVEVTAPSTRLLSGKGSSLGKQQRSSSSSSGIDSPPSPTYTNNNTAAEKRRRVSPDEDDYEEIVEAAVMLVALRRSDTADAIIGNGGASVENVKSLDTALVTATASGKRSATSLQHQLVIIAHSPFTSASPVYTQHHNKNNNSTNTTTNYGYDEAGLGGFITPEEVAAAATYPSASVIPHSPQIPCVCGGSSNSGDMKGGASKRYEATLAVTNLPKGRYFIVPCTRRGGQIGFDVIVRCFASSSALRLSSVHNPNLRTSSSSSGGRASARFTGAIRPLGDWARDQQLLDFEQETLLRRSVATGLAAPSRPLVTADQRVSKHEEGSTDSKTIQLHVDRDFPPMPSSLWLDTEHSYPNAPPVEKAWLRLVDIVHRQQEAYLNTVVDGVGQEEEANTEKGISRLTLERKREELRSYLRALMLRRKPALGLITAISTGGVVGSSAEVSAESSNMTAADRLRQETLAELDDENNADDGHRSLPPAGFWNSGLFASHGHRALPPAYTGCTYDHTNLGSEWYLSALACIVTRPTTFAARFLGDSLPPNIHHHPSSHLGVVSEEEHFLGYNPTTGTAAFRFFIDGRWVRVVVDDFLPVDSSGQPSFTASITDGDFLAPLVEKAYAKVHRCYAALSVDRGVVRKRVLGVLPAKEEKGSDLLLAVEAGGAEGGGGGDKNTIMPPRPPAASPLTPTAPSPLVLADQSATIDKTSAGAHFRRTVLNKQSTSSASSVKVQHLSDAVVLTTDATGRDAPRAPTAPVLENDSASYGIDVESAHDAHAQRRRKSQMRLGLNTDSRRFVHESLNLNTTSSSKAADEASSPLYALSGTINGVRYGEPPLVLLHQALTDFTGGVVRIYDITPSVASGMSGNGGGTFTAKRAGTTNTAISTSVSPSQQQQHPSHLGNNTTDSSAYFTNNLLPPHLSETISSSLYLCEDLVMNRRDLAWQKILECAFNPEKIIAASFMTGAQGWEQRRHCGLVLNALYPFVDAREVDGQRLVKVFNNWGSANVVVGAHGPEADREKHHNTLWWRGKFGWGSSGSNQGQDERGEAGKSGEREDDEGWTDRIKTAVGYDVTHSKTCFWMSIAEVVYYFSHLFEVTYDAAAVASSAEVGGGIISSSTKGPDSRVWVEGGYSAEHIGGSLKSTSWINNDQYALRILDAVGGLGKSKDSDGRGQGRDDKDGSSSAQPPSLSITVGIHQANQRVCMVRSRDARYTYADKPLGLCIIRTNDNSRRVARLSTEDVVTTLYPAAVRDRYYSFSVPSEYLLPPSPSSSNYKYILMPFVSVSGANDDEVRWASAHSLTNDAAKDEASPFFPKRSVKYFISVSSRDTVCSVTKISDDTRTTVDGEWVATTETFSRLSKAPPLAGQSSSSVSPHGGTVLCSSLGVTEDAAGAAEGTCMHATAGGPPELGTWRNNPQFLLYPSRDGEVTITLRQRDIVPSGAAVASAANGSPKSNVININSSSNTTKHIGFVVVDATASHLTRLLHLESKIYNDNTDMLVIPNTVVLNVSHTNDHAVVGSVKLFGMQTRRGKPYHIVPSCLESGVAGQGGFTIEVTAADPVKITPIPRDRDWKSVVIPESFKLSAGNAGGSPIYSTWRNNPQYCLKFPFEQTSRLLIAVTNKNKNDTDKIGCLLFAADKFGRKVQSVTDPATSAPTTYRKLLISNDLAKPLCPALVEAPAANISEEAERARDEGPHTASLLGPSYNRYRLGTAPTSSRLLEEERIARLGGELVEQPTTATKGKRGAVSRPLDVLVDTGAYPHHAEVFYDVAVSSPDEGVILMPYTLVPMTECDVEITIYSTAHVEVSAISEYSVSLTEGAWVPGVNAGGARGMSAVANVTATSSPLINNMWINNPFYTLNLLGSTLYGKPTRLFIVMLMYANGPEKPAMRKVGKVKVIVPPTTATVPPLSTMLALVASREDEGDDVSYATSSSGVRKSTGLPIRASSAAFRANSALERARASVSTSSSSNEMKNENVSSASSRGLKALNDLVHNTHTSVARRSSFGFDIVRGDDLYSPVYSSRHTCEGEATMLVEAMLPCSTTQLPYYIVPHTRDQGVEGYFKLIVYSDRPIELSEHQKPKRYW